MVRVYAKCNPASHTVATFRENPPCLASLNQFSRMMFQLMFNWRFCNKVFASAVVLASIPVMNLKIMRNIENKPVKQCVLLTFTHAAINVSVASATPCKLHDSKFVAL
jgi:hypothetical protein